MENEFEILYLLTALMLLFAVIIIMFIAWTSKKFSQQNKLILKFGQRIECVESLVRTEFAAVLNQLKKL